MSKFQVGERVLFFEKGDQFIGEVYSHIVESNWYGIHVGKSLAKYLHYPIHEKQIRRLKKRKPLRTFWLNFYPKVYTHDPACYVHETKEQADRQGTEVRSECLEVREVRKKK